MKRLSNAELRILCLRRSFLKNFMDMAAVYTLDDNWREYLDRMNAVRNEIREIVEDPHFDTLVSKPKVSRPGQNTFAGTGTVINVMGSARELLTYIDGLLELHVTPKSQELKQDPTRSARVFIGHGRNDIVRSKVKDFIRDRCALEPLVLQDMPSAGLTVIEKLERYGRTADYAILILTGEDIVAETNAKRARQNVIQELGWFQGILGRNRTAILVQDGVEIASNIAGVVVLKFVNDNVEMIFESLRKEFEDAGLMK